eukprot:3798756-Ditylum_brightwellii.AAC.1
MTAHDIDGGTTFAYSGALVERGDEESVDPNVEEDAGDSSLDVLAHLLGGPPAEVGSLVSVVLHERVMHELHMQVKGLLAIWALQSW